MMNRKYSDRELADIYYRQFSSQDRPLIVEEILKDSRSRSYLEYLEGMELMNAPIQSSDSDTSLTEKRKKLYRELTDRLHQTRMRIRRWERPAKVSFGELYETSLPLNWPQPYQPRRLVVVLSAEEGCFDPQNPDVLVVPVSFDTEYASKNDLIIPEEDSGLQAELMLRFDDIQPIFVSQLKSKLGAIPESYHDAIQAFWKQTVGLPSNATEYLQNRQRKTDPLEGPVHRFRLQEHEITAYMREPVRQALMLAQEHEDILTIDLSHRVRTEDILEEAAMMEEQEVLLLAADAAEQSLESVWLGEDRLYLLADSDTWAIQLDIRKDLVQFKMVSNTTLENWKFTIFHKDEELMSVHLSLEAWIPGLIPIRPLRKFLNKPLNIAFHREGDPAHIVCRLRLAHVYIDR
ncbi:MAG: hypothetical protein Q9P14_15995 [candidate division KSB1 bacterium]|nr:hypothetical protein [candidate division KSB1 bacterium]